MKCFRASTFESHFEKHRGELFETKVAMRFEGKKGRRTQVGMDKAVMHSTGEQQWQAHPGCCKVQDQNPTKV